MNHLWPIASVVGVQLPATPNHQIPPVVANVARVIAHAQIHYQIPVDLFLNAIHNFAKDQYLGQDLYLLDQDVKNEVLLLAESHLAVKLP